MFVPSIDGRSHDITENTDEADIRRGLRVFAAAAGKDDRAVEQRTARPLHRHRAGRKNEHHEDDRCRCRRHVHRHRVLRPGAPARSPFTRSPRRPDDPSRGIMQGIAEICRDNGVAAGDIDYVLHGTTTATNAVLEHKGARAGMLTNEGFRDIIHIARHQRVEHYSIMQELPWQNRPLVKRRHRKVVQGQARFRRAARSWSRSTKPACVAAARELKAEGVEAVAVCFLFSYLNPAHEERAQGHPRARAARRLHHHVVIGLAAVPRVRALHHGLPVRLHRTEDARLHRPSRRRAARRRARMPICGSWPRTAAWPRRPWSARSR